MDIPYADPDAAGIHETGRGEDLGRHFRRGAEAYLAALEATPSASTMLADGVLTRAQAATLRARMKRVVVLTPGSLVETDAANMDLGSGLSGFVIDSSATDALVSAEATTFAKALFEHHLSGNTTATLVAVAEIGTGRSLNVPELERCLVDIADSEWVELGLLSETTGTALPKGEVREAPPAPSAAPQDYWDLAGEARMAADALAFAMGEDHPLAVTAIDSSLIAESALWAGGDDKWSLAERGRSHASAAVRAGACSTS